jgi:starvation-inducible DNA-binding protein
MSAAKQDGFHHRTRIAIGEIERGRLIQLLNATLATSIDLQTQAKHAHWNVGGMDFSSLRELFDETARAATQACDLLAERVLQLGGAALGTARIAAQHSILGEYPHRAIEGKQHVEALAERLAIFGNQVREAIAKSAEFGDPTTSGIYTEISRAVDKNLWMLEAHLYN